MTRLDRHERFCKYLSAQRSDSRATPELGCADHTSNDLAEVHADPHIELVLGCAAVLRQPTAKRCTREISQSCDAFKPK